MTGKKPKEAVNELLENKFKIHCQINASVIKIKDPRSIILVELENAQIRAIVRVHKERM